MRTFVDCSQPWKILTSTILPANVPPVPVEKVTASTLPSVCCQISGPVVSKCALLLDMLSNWKNKMGY